MTGPTTTRVVLTDANILINLIHVDRLRLLAALPGYEFVVLDHVIEEIKRPEQKEALEKAIADSVVQTESLTDSAAITLYAELKQVMGSGEAACLAQATTAGCFVASDERRKFKREAESRLGTGRIITTPGIDVLAIRASVITVEEADADKDALEKQRFRMTFASFKDVIGG